MKIVRVNSEAIEFDNGKHVLNVWAEILDN